MIGKRNAPKKYEIARVGRFHQEAFPALAYRKTSGSLPQVDNPTMAPMAIMTAVAVAGCGTDAIAAPLTEVSVFMTA